MTLESNLYLFAAVLQVAAMFFAVRMAREVNDRRPWLILFLSLSIMFAARVTASFIPLPIREQMNPWLAVLISFLLLVSLFFIRRVAVAEREARNLADQRTAERDESENRYRTVVELCPDALFVHVGGKIAYANAAALHLFGAGSSMDLVGRGMWDLISPETLPVVRERAHHLVEVGHRVPAIGEEWLRLDGSRVPVEVAKAVIPWRGDKGIQVILRDISERKRAEDEISQLLAGERTARSDAERASRMKDEFLATLSHELRTPLNAILGWAQILRMPEHDAVDLKQGLEVIDRNARAQTKLIEDLLDMSRIISGKLRLDIQRLAPATCIEAAIETVRPSAAAKGVRLESILDPLAGPISGDPNRLQQVVWNLLSNAVKFTPRGGKVQVVLQRVNSHIEVSVGDTGQGISVDFLPFVFDRFRQADGSITRRQGGLGLGLAIVKHLVELHGGAVAVKSAGEGQGSTFIVSLPLTVVHPHVEEGQRRHPVSSCEGSGVWGSVDLTGLSILVVDDEPDACHLIRRVLGEYHATVSTACSAAEALAWMETCTPDVLVSDIGMPEVDGYEFLRRVRARGPGRGGKVPAIALTAFARSEDRTRALMAGYSVHVAKPVEPREFVATVASLAGRTGNP